MKSNLLIVLLVSLFLASCSGSRYGHMPKVKKGNNNTQAQKTYKKKEIAPLVNVAGKTIQTASPAAQEVTFTAINTPTESPKQITPNKKSLRQIVKTNKGEESTLIPAITLKVKKLTKTKAQNEERSRSWLWYIVVGIIFILIGALIGTIIGSILYLVGVIAIIFGLLALLGIV